MPGLSGEANPELAQFACARTGALLNFAHCDSAAVARPDSRGLLHVVLSKRPRRLGGHDRSYAEAEAAEARNRVPSPSGRRAHHVRNGGDQRGIRVVPGGSRPEAYAN